MDKKNVSTNSIHEVVYEGKMFEVVRFEGKPGVMYEKAVRSPGVRLIIECKKGGEPALLMTKELRTELEQVDYRLPGGKVVDSLVEFNQLRQNQSDLFVKAKEAAIKEARQEAGVTGGEFTQVEISKAGGSVEWDLYYFLVTNATFGAQELEEDEKGYIETIMLSAKEIFEKLKAGEIQEGRSAAVLWWWLAKNRYVTFVG